MTWVPAILLGLTGSIHCAGMCSPLAMAVTRGSRSGLTHRISYNTGRILTYGILGMAFSFAGDLIPLSGYQNIFSIILGVVILIVGITGITNVRIPVLTVSMTKFSIYIKKIFSNTLTRKGLGATFMLGMVNGLLPCGLVALALTYCITLENPIEGLQFMTLFGVGTLPVMIGLVSVGAYVTQSVRVNSASLMKGLMIASGILLIVRVFVVHHHDPSVSHGLLDTILCN